MTARSIADYPALNIFVGNDFADLRTPSGTLLIDWNAHTNLMTRHPDGMTSETRPADSLDYAYWLKRELEQAGTFVAVFPVLGQGRNEYDPTGTVKLCNA